MPRISIYVQNAEEAKGLLRSLRKEPQVQSADLMKRLYEVKPHYSVQDLEAIAALFPKDKKWTYSECCEVFPANTPIEIIDSNLYFMPSPKLEHQQILKKVFRKIDTFVNQKQMGEVIISPADVVLDSKNTVQPDLIFVSNGKKSILKDVIRGVPDVLIEITSSKEKHDTETKMALYQRFGVAEYWLVSPKKKEIKVHTLREKVYQLFSQAKKKGSVSSEQIEGLEVEVSEVFE
jgi:Uma2 family endonuclease